VTECSRRNREGSGRAEQITLDFPGGKPITLAFDAEDVTSDSGLAALGALDARLDLLAAAMRFVEDLRSPDMIVHPLDRLLREAVLAYVAGYGDACDHAPLARDPLFTRLVGPANAETRNPRPTEALASEATISRLLHARKVDVSRLGFVHVEQFVMSLGCTRPAEITLDLDGYDAPTYGQQQLALWNGHFEATVYYPLVATVAEFGFAVGALLRAGNAWSGAEAVPLLEPIIVRLREALPGTRIRVRADSGFMDPELYDMLERHGVEYAIRLRMNARLRDLVDEVLGERVARMMARCPGRAWAIHGEARHFVKSWGGERRVVLKVQYDPAKGEIERYVIVTNSRRSKTKVWKFYEKRGLCEQRIDELKNHLAADRFSLSTFESNSTRLHLVTMAHNLFAAGRMVLPPRHELKRATVERLRMTLVKCGAVVIATARRVWLHASRNWPWRELLADVARRFSEGRLRPTPLWDAG
jgi:hypothetical protein